MFNRKQKRIEELESINKALISKQEYDESFNRRRLNESEREVVYLKKTLSVDKTTIKSYEELMSRLVVVLMNEPMDLFSYEAKSRIRFNPGGDAVLFRLHVVDQEEKLRRSREKARVRILVDEIVKERTSGENPGPTKDDPAAGW